MDEALLLTASYHRLLPEKMAARHDRLLASLRGTRGVRLANGYSGTLRSGRRTAHLQIEPGDWITVRLRVEAPPSPQEAVCATHGLPANLRYAAGEKGLTLVGETRVDGVRHISESLEELRLGLSGALAKRRRCRGAPAELPSPETVRAALHEASGRVALDPTSLIEGEDGWELRTRLEGSTVATRITREPGGVRVAHAITRAECDPEAATPLAVEALRWNARVRFARIVAEGGRLSVETRLRTALVSGDWLALACQAVAATVLHSRPTLRHIAEDARLSRAYAAVFPNRLDTNH